ncbi:hypothetical protein H0H81_004785 [Sphagnurus paluster]|uniref:RNase III domain-containing protein n=1 Tax=Sphagnurus paluster TaxID=117069 RepID=A0A9P7KJD2_9AGAR|nr:hypothetical protein H0H81_004785 [Sphagnurus paluster]
MSSRRAPRPRRRSLNAYLDTPNNWTSAHVTLPALPGPTLQHARNANRFTPGNNDVLEFIGDRVVNLGCALIAVGARHTPGERTLNLHAHASLSPADAHAIQNWSPASSSSTPPKVLADLLEAYIGALYTSSDWGPTYTCLRAVYAPVLAAAARDVIFTAAPRAHIVPPRWRAPDALPWSAYIQHVFLAFIRTRAEQMRTSWEAALGVRKNARAVLLGGEDEEIGEQALKLWVCDAAMQTVPTLVVGDARGPHFLTMVTSAIMSDATLGVLAWLLSLSVYLSPDDPAFLDAYPTEPLSNKDNSTRDGDKENVPVTPEHMQDGGPSHPLHLPPLPHATAKAPAPVTNTKKSNAQQYTDTNTSNIPFSPRTEALLSRSAAPAPKPRTKKPNALENTSQQNTNVKHISSDSSALPSRSTVLVPALRAEKSNALGYAQQGSSVKRTRTRIRIDAPWLAAPVEDAHEHGGAPGVGADVVDAVEGSVQDAENTQNETQREPSPMPDTDKDKDKDTHAEPGVDAAVLESLSVVAPPLSLEETPSPVPLPLVSHTSPQQSPTKLALPKSTSRLSISYLCEYVSDEEDEDEGVDGDKDEGSGSDMEFSSEEDGDEGAGDDEDEGSGSDMEFSTEEEEEECRGVYTVAGAAVDGERGLGGGGEIVGEVGESEEGGGGEEVEGTIEGHPVPPDFESESGSGSDSEVESVGSGAEAEAAAAVRKETKKAGVEGQERGKEKEKETECNSNVGLQQAVEFGGRMWSYRPLRAVLLDSNSKGGLGDEELKGGGEEEEEETLVVRPSLLRRKFVPII